MGKLYDANGAKMDVVQACQEFQLSINHDQAVNMNDQVKQYDGGWTAQRKVAHMILDTYVGIESTTTDGQRLRKVMDWLMTKYQKSNAMCTDTEIAAYNSVLDVVKNLAEGDGAEVEEE